MISPRTFYSPAGPGRQRCLTCGTSISTNALARASHERGAFHRAARDNSIAKACPLYRGGCGPDDLCPDGAYCHRQGGGS